MANRPRRRVAAIGAGALLLVGVALAGIAAAGRTAAAEEETADRASIATAPVVRRVIQSSDLLDGTLGFAGAYTITNWLETTADGAGGAASSPDQAYLAAKAQYDTAVANRALLRNPTKADITRARAALAQAQAALRTAQQADDGPTTAQRAAARSAVHPGRGEPGHGRGPARGRRGGACRLFRGDRGGTRRERVAGAGL